MHVSKSETPVLQEKNIFLRISLHRDKTITKGVSLIYYLELSQQFLYLIMIFFIHVGA